MLRTRASSGLAARVAARAYGSVAGGKSLEGFPLKNEEDFRLFITDDAGKQISPWHDIPLFSPDGYVSERARENAAFFCVVSTSLVRDSPLTTDYTPSHLLLAAPSSSLSFSLSLYVCRSRSLSRRCT